MQQQECIVNYMELGFSGSWSTDFTSQSFDPTTTVIDGGSSTRVLDMVGVISIGENLSVSLSDLSINNGSTNNESGAGLRIEGGDPDVGGSLMSLNAQNVHFNNNEAAGSGSGGALYTNG